MYHWTEHVGKTEGECMSGAPKRKQPDSYENRILTLRQNCGKSHDVVSMTLRHVVCLFQLKLRLDVINALSKIVFFSKQVYVALFVLTCF